MKLLTASALLLATLIVVQDVEAQTRGPRYNQPGGGGGGSSRPSGGGMSRPSGGGGSTYRPSPSPSRPSPSTGSTYRPSPSPSRPSGPRYNPPSTGGSTYRPSPNRPGPVITRPTTPTGPRYNPPSSGGSTYRPRPTPTRPGPVITRPRTPTGPRYNPPGGTVRPGQAPRGPNYGRNYNPPRYTPRPSTAYRPIRTNYGSRMYHRPYGYNPIRYSGYYHSPYRSPYFHTTRFYRSYDWYNHVYRTFPNYIYAHWIFYPGTGYNNGYWTIDNYPWYVFNGYRYRYSTVDYCNYQLLDQYNHQVIQSYWGQSCNTGYDNCSYLRDQMNAQSNDFRYVCTETFRDQNYDYSTPSYEDTYQDTTTGDDYYGGGTCEDIDSDGQCDSSEVCNDMNNDGYCDA